MKKPYIRLLLFLVLILALATGLSYLSLHHVSKSKEDQDNKKMDVALVNEDDGATLSQENVDFGDAFVKSMDKNDEQDWHVVSRGVAENGLDRGTYDMMLVIPNDFSQKASSMDSEEPEQVALDYKINASDNDKVQAQAEETASSILNDFNRQIIDVYFANVIGNLQDAQDNIGEIVEEEAKHTYAYNDSIHNPLSNYTDQFESVKDNTATSKDSFSGLEDVLDSFEDDLTDQVDSNQDYQSDVEDTADQKESNNETRSDFLDHLDDFDDGLSSDDVEEELQNLQDTNEYINDQFQMDDDDDTDEEMESIEIDTKIVKDRLAESLETVESAHNELEEELGDDGNVNQEIEERLEEIVGEAFDDDKDEDNDLKELFKTQDEQIIGKIEDQITGLPSLDEEAIEDSDLSSETKQEIQNVIQVTEKYNDSDEFEAVEPESDNDLLPDHIHELKEHLHDNGITLEDTVEIPENKKDKQLFNLSDIPKEFKFENLSLKFPDQDEENYSHEDIKVDEPFSVDSNDHGGEFKVKLTIKLKDKYVDGNLDHYNVYTPAKWSWDLHQVDKKDEAESDDDKKDVKNISYTSTQTPDAPLVASKTTSKDDEKTKSDSNESGDGESDDGDDDEESSDDSDDDDEKEEEDKDKSGDNDDESDGDDDSDSGEDDEDEEKEDNSGKASDEDDDDKTLTIVNNHITHKVTDPVIDKSTENLINAVENTIAPYEKLLSSYETYFGLDLSDEELDLEDDEEESLEDLVSEDSLYYFFNEKDVNDLLTKYVVREITDNVTEEIRDPLEELEEQIDDHREFIEETDDNAEALVEKVGDTKDESRNLNKSLKETLDNITDWREKSQDLVDNQVDIQDKSDDEHSAVMELGSNFDPLLTQSESLADQSSSNLDSADQVYSTFDRIDDQADSIDQSGTDLVQEAEDLSVTMTNKVTEDEDYMDNFSEVMDNSRIDGHQNKDLYSFLSDPVDTENKGMMIKGDTFTPYFLVLLSFIVALFTAYVISITNQRRMAGDQFEAEKSLMGSNALITGITATIGVVEGLVIGLLSAYYLGISEGDLVMWTGLMILILLSMVLVSTYLLRQLKMIGMFILLAVMSMYLFLTEALGSGFAGSDALRAYSPLQYLETMLTKAIQGGFDHPFVLFGVFVVILLATLANLLVLHRAGSGTKEDEDVAEAQ